MKNDLDLIVRAFGETFKCIEPFSDSIPEGSKYAIFYVGNEEIAPGKSGPFVHLIVDQRSLELSEQALKIVVEKGISLCSQIIANPPARGKRYQGTIHLDNDAWYAESAMLFAKNQGLEDARDGRDRYGSGQTQRS